MAKTFFFQWRSVLRQELGPDEPPEVLSNLRHFIRAVYCYYLSVLKHYVSCHTASELAVGIQADLCLVLSILVAFP